MGRIQNRKTRTERYYGGPNGKKILSLLGGIMMVCLVGCTDTDVLPGEAVSYVRDMQESETSIPADTESAALITVHVCGSVKVPGVYRLAEGSRVADAVEAAGGFSEQAAVAYRNLAAVVQDGEKIVIPDVADVTEDFYGEEAGKEQGDGKVNINTAGMEQLMTLPGIGEAKAEAILFYRETNGAFLAAEDIMQVSGIKEAAFEKIKNYITIGP